MAIQENDPGEPAARRDYDRTPMPINGPFGLTRMFHQPAEQETVAASPAMSLVARVWLTCGTQIKADQGEAHQRRIKGANHLDEIGSSALVLQGNRNGAGVYRSIGCLWQSGPNGDDGA